MDGCPTQLMLDHIKVLATMQSEISALQRSVSDLGTIKDTLSRLTTLNEQEMEFNRNQVKSNKEFEVTLININENLTKLNGRVSMLEQTEEETKLAKKDITDKNAKDKEAQEIELVRQATEKRKSNLILIGVMFTSVLSFIGLVISIILK